MRRVVHDPANEHGATAVLVAICLLVLFGAGAIAIDIGSGFETKRELVVDTDAAALAAAETIAAGGDCTAAKDTAAQYISLNTGATFTATDLDAAGNTWDCDLVDETVTVGLSQLAEQTLSGAIGAGAIDVYGATVAQIGENQPSGLRPITVCTLDPSISAWMAGGAGTRIILPHDKTYGQGNRHDPNGACGGAPGNWGFTCFDKDAVDGSNDTQGCNNTNSSNNIDDMLRYGYSGDVDLGTAAAGDEDCQTEDDTATICEQTPGSLGNSINPGLQYLRDNAIVFPILGISSYAPGSGQNATTTASSFLAVKVISYELTGNNKHFVLELVNYFNDGTASTLNEGSLSTRAPSAICGTEVDQTC